MAPAPRGATGGLDRDLLFSILYYCYRQKRKGAQVLRDFFPFCTWGSGPDSSGFSFSVASLPLREQGDKTRGHFLFIPWGDDWEDG